MNQISNYILTIKIHFKIIFLKLNFSNLLVIVFAFVYIKYFPQVCFYSRRLYRRPFSKVIYIRQALIFLLCFVRRDKKKKNVSSFLGELRGGGYGAVGKGSGGGYMDFAGLILRLILSSLFSSVIFFFLSLYFSLLYFLFFFFFFFSS